MKKLGRNFWRFILLMISLPLIFKYYDIFTAPTTGLLVTAGMDDMGLAIATAIPWALPVIVFIVIVFDMSKPDDDNTGNGLKFPTFK
jgi:hypothetical protein